MEEVKVKVVEFGNRKYYQMQFRDPMTGRKVTRSTRVERTGRKQDRIKAERVAAKFEAELREGRYREPSKVTWAEFRQRYEDEVLTGLAEATDLKVSGIFNTVEAILKPTRLRDVNEQRLSHYTAELRRRGRSEDTLAGHLAHLGAALRWAERVGLLPKAPRIERPKRAKGSKAMKGRPITGEEFERMLDKLPTVVGEKARPSWRHFLNGLWWSGLRLDESLELWWDREGRLCVDLSNEHVMLRIPAELEKGHRDRLLPVAPEFAEFLLAVPDDERTGRVFNPKPRKVRGERLTTDRISRLITDVGKKANVVVHVDPKSKKVKYASAHDLRRSFGVRWATRVMPPVLKELMRHESIDTTMKYYVGQNAQNTAKTLWAAYQQGTGGKAFGNTPQSSPSNPTTSQTAKTDESWG